MSPDSSTTSRPRSLVKLLIVVHGCVVSMRYINVCNKYDGKVMYFGSFYFMGELGFMNCAVICAGCVYVKRVWSARVMTMMVCGRGRCGCCEFGACVCR